MKKSKCVIYKTDPEFLAFKNSEAKDEIHSTSTVLSGYESSIDYLLSVVPGMTIENNEAELLKILKSTSYFDLKVMIIAKLDSIKHKDVLEDLARTDPSNLVKLKALQKLNKVTKVKTLKV